MNWIQQTRRPPTNVNRIHCGFVAQPLVLALGLPNGAARLSDQALTPAHSRRPKQLRMPSYLPANRLNIRRKPTPRHHPGMKITIRPPPLAHRHLHVNPHLPPLPTTPPPPPP